MSQNLDWSKLFSEAQSRLKPSAIREILKVTRKPGIISFAGGVPDPKLFPYQQLENCLQAVAKNVPQYAYQYGLTQGTEELISDICKLASELGRPTGADNVLITNGSQQGLFLVARLFLEEGDAVAVTRPCYLGALQAFAGLNPRFLEVHCDDDGPRIESLEAALKQKPKYFYIVPAFQNPTGQSVSESRAALVLEVCRKYGVPIIEDAAYEGLYYDELPLSLRALEAQTLQKESANYNDSGNVIFLGTFSKVVAPGFRIGWVEAPDAVAKSLVVLKQAADLHTSSFNQLVLSHFIRNFSETYWAQLRVAYRRKRDVMLDLVEKLLGPELSYHSRPKGGLFVWIEAKRKIDFGALLTKAVEKESIAFVPGAPFFALDPLINTARISFATASEQEMETGIGKLQKLILES